MSTTSQKQSSEHLVQPWDPGQNHSWTANAIIRTTVADFSPFPLGVAAPTLLPERILYSPRFSVPSALDSKSLGHVLKP